MQIFDSIIIGGGSAGLSAALMLGRARRRVLVVDAGAPRNGVAPHMHGVLGHDGRSPLDLLADGRRELERYGIAVRPAEATHVERSNREFALTVGDERVLARTLLVATGLRDELPDIPGLGEQWGTGAVVCPYCDGWESRDARIAVLGTAPASVHHAQMLRQWSPRVTFFPLVSRLDEADAAALRARGIEIDERPIERVETDAAGALLGLRVGGGALVEVDRIFLHSRPVPRDEVLRALGAAASARFGGGEWVDVDQLGRTSVPGLWAAGNVTTPAANVPVSMAAGAMAGAGINAELVEEEVRAAVAAAGAVAAAAAA